jgi:hypothetical protein
MPCLTKGHKVQNPGAAQGRIMVVATGISGIGATAGGAEKAVCHNTKPPLQMPMSTRLR